MEDSTVRGDARRSFVGVLPETLEEAEELAASIERAVQCETDWGIADLSVEVGTQGVLLRGRCDTYYAKQLAQHAAMRVSGGDRLVNSIEVA
jgi:osmotically-inducible protein OsmY